MFSSISRWLWAVPLVVGPDQAGSVHGQDAIANPQPAVGGGRSVWDQSADVDARSVEGSVLQAATQSFLKCLLKVTLLKKHFTFLIAILSAKNKTWLEFVGVVRF